jgi:SAM-dependent methyltransferase
MDTWKFYDITHRDHVVCNPTSIQKLDELIGLLDLGPEPRVLDIASGKGEFIVRVAERFGGPAGRGIRGVAIDISPYCTADLRTAAARRIPAAEIEVLEMDGADYRPAAGTFDLASCLGAGWTFGGHRPTLRFLAQATRPGGCVVVGEPFWKREPVAEYLAWSGLRRDEYGSHAQNVEAGEAEGLVPWLALVSPDDDWDRYETLQWRAAARYADSHLEDPDVTELLTRVEKSRREYLNWGRDTLGWALYLFAKGRSRTLGSMNCQTGSARPGHRPRPPRRRPRLRRADWPDDASTLALPGLIDRNALRQLLLPPLDPYAYGGYEQTSVPDHATVVVQLIDGAAGALDPFAAMEPARVAGAGVVVVAVAVERVEAAQEAAIRVHLRQARLDHLACAFGRDQLGQEDVTEVVLRPDPPAAPVDEFFAGEVRAAEVAVVVDEVAGRMLEIMRALTMRKQPGPSSDVGLALGLDDEGHEIIDGRHIHAAPPCVGELAVSAHRR